MSRSNSGYSRPAVLVGISEVESGEILSRELTAAGCRTKRANTVAECLSLLEKHDFALAVLDTSLNGSDGVDASKVFQRGERLPAKIPWILTSTGSPLTVQQLTSAMRAGARDVVEMPPNPAMIEQLVRLAHEGRSSDDSSRMPDVVVPATENGAQYPPESANGLHGETTNGVEAAASRARNNAQNADVRCNERLTELTHTLVGDSPSMAAIRQLILEVAPTRASVMIYGESGTGKELVAQAIHRYSKQASAPFVPVNMAAIPHGLADSVLFGQEMGAFASAMHHQKGWCEAADGGTLFLDEVSDLELPVQPKLLRLLQEGALQRVGSQASHRVSVRVIAATNQNPRAVIAGGRMREDLFFRLHVVPIYVPPLRDRQEDIPKLAMQFLRRSAERHDRMVEGFSENALRVLMQHDWPGNVRQLENTVERIVIFARGPIVDADQIPADDHLVSAYAERRRILAGATAECADNQIFDASACLTPIERHERAVIVDALRRVDGHVIDAARLLGLGQATVYRKIKQYEIPHVRKRRRERPR